MQLIKLLHNDSGCKIQFEGRVLGASNDVCGAAEKMLGCLVKDA